jgi:putative oxidoreductase
MEAIMDFNSLGLLIIRVGLGLSLSLQHGLDKLLNFSKNMDAFPDPVGMGSTLSLTAAVFGEVLCAIALILGFLTRWAAAYLAVFMAAAFFLIHGKDAFAAKELAFLYMVAFIGLCFTGAGVYSADGIFRKRK